MNVTFSNDTLIPAPYYFLSIFACGGCINGILALLLRPIVIKFYKKYKSHLLNNEVLNSDYFIENPGFTDEDICCICLDNFSDTNNIKTLKCNHFFHSDCIYQWIQEKKICPLCKTNIN